MFNKSIRENIRIGKKGASDAEVIEAAKKAQADDFIRALSDGYDTLAGEAGGKLSGGQRQRIAFARAILKDAPCCYEVLISKQLGKRKLRFVQAA